MAVDFTKGMVDSPTFNKNNPPSENQLVLLGILNDGSPEGNAATIEATAFFGRSEDNPLTPTDFNNLVDILKRDLAELFQPIGTIIPWIGYDPNAGSSVTDEVKYKLPVGDNTEWRVCNGSSISRTNYPDLFALIGTTYGSSDNSHFNLPDFRGRMLGGGGINNNDPQGTLAYYGYVGTGDQEGGQVAVTLDVSQLPSHFHSYIYESYPDSTLVTSDPDGNVEVLLEDGSSTDNDIRSIDTFPTGGNQAHENRPPFSVVNWIIRVR